MRRRITEAIVGVAALILLALGIPLAVAIHESVLDSEVVELQAVAARTLAEVAVPLDPAQLAGIGSEDDAPPPFAVYDAAGHLVFGDGPATPDGAVQQALRGSPASATHDEIVVATPIIDDTAGSEQVVGALRSTESLAGVDRRSRVAWAIMAASALVALGVGWVIARRVARRLSRPVVELAAAAASLGDGGTFAVPASSGVAELDTLAAALADNSVRISEAIERERRFSTDVSHQLRTPLTGLRLVLESARDHPDPAAIERALEEVGRLEATTEHLLAFARDAVPAPGDVRPEVIVGEAVARWTRLYAAGGRRLVGGAPASGVGSGTGGVGVVRGSAAALGQVLDILIDNALVHGAGTVTVSVRRLAGGAAIDVADEGSGVEHPERIFERGEGRGHGIGLALARSLAEADGGRLLLTQARPAVFSVVTLSAEPD